MAFEGQNFILQGHIDPGMVLEATILAFKGHSLQIWFADDGFYVATICVYHAVGVPFGGGFVTVGVNSGHLWIPDTVEC